MAHKIKWGKIATAFPDAFSRFFRAIPNPSIKGDDLFQDGVLYDISRLPYFFDFYDIEFNIERTIEGKFDAYVASWSMNGSAGKNFPTRAKATAFCVEKCFELLESYFNDGQSDIYLTK